MVPNIRRGSRTHGLLVHLYGPGKRDEHTDPHLVGSWDGFAPDPGRDTSPPGRAPASTSRRPHAPRAARVPARETVDPVSDCEHVGRPIGAGTRGKPSRESSHKLMPS
jgi:hypothetical protein